MAFNHVEMAVGAYSRLAKVTVEHDCRVSHKRRQLLSPDFRTLGGPPKTMGPATSGLGLLGEQGLGPITERTLLLCWKAGPQVGLKK